MNSTIAQPYVLFQSYASTTDCTGAITDATAFPTGVCEVAQSDYETYTCTDSNPYVNIYSTSNCAGNPTQQNLLPTNCFQR